MALTPLYQLTQPTVGASAGAWGGTPGLNGDLASIDMYLGSPRISVNSPTVAGTTTLNLNATPATAFAFTLSQNTTIAITNCPTALPNAGACMVRVLIQITNGGSHTLTWPGTVTWNGGAPVLQTSGVDLIELWTIDGVNFYGARINSPASAVKRHTYASLASDYSLSAGINEIPWNLNDASDVGNLHSTSSNPSKIIIPSGWEGFGIILTFHAELTGLQVNDVDIRIALAGGGPFYAAQHSSTTTGTCLITTSVYLPAPQQTNAFVAQVYLYNGGGMTGTEKLQVGSTFSGIQTA